MCICLSFIYKGTHNKHVAYASLYFMAMGIYGTVPVVAAWISNNSEPYYTRATAIAFCFMATNLGGILSTWSYPTNEGPRFKKTNTMNLILYVFCDRMFVFLSHIISFK